MFTKCKKLGKKYKIPMGCIYNSKKVQLKTQSTCRETKKINSVVNSVSFG
jgi:hypothetical protein